MISFKNLLSTLSFEEWLKMNKELNKNVDEFSLILNKITGKHNEGLTPDIIKNSIEFKKAKNDFNKSFKKLQDFNKNSPKKFVQMKAKNDRSNRFKNTSK